MQPSLTPFVVFASVQLSSDAKVLYALLNDHRVAALAEQVLDGRRRQRALKELVAVGLLEEGRNGYGIAGHEVFVCEEFRIRGFE